MAKTSSLFSEPALCIYIPVDCVTAASDEDDDEDELAAAASPIPLAAASLSRIPCLK